MAAGVVGAPAATGAWSGRLVPTRDTVPPVSRCAEKLAALGVRDQALVGALPSTWQQACKGQPWQWPYLVPGVRQEKASPR